MVFLCTKCRVRNISLSFLIIHQNILFSPHKTQKWFSHKSEKVYDILVLCACYFKPRPGRRKRVSHLEFYVRTKAQKENRFLKILIHSVSLSPRKCRCCPVRHPTDCQSQEPPPLPGDFPSRPFADIQLGYPPLLRFLSALSPLKIQILLGKDVCQVTLELMSFIKYSILLSGSPGPPLLLS